MANKDSEFVYLIDLINILSFIIGVQNLDLNNKQIQDLEQMIKKVDLHLEQQDQKINDILKCIN